MWCNLRFLTTKAGPNALSTISKTASRKTIIVNGQTVKTFSPEWILREKILSPHEREGTLKEATDIRDVANMLWLVISGKPELNFDHDQKLKDALGRLLQKRPALEPRLRQKIECTAVFGTWYKSLSVQSDRLLTEAVL